MKTPIRRAAVVAALGALVGSVATVPGCSTVCSTSNLAPDTELSVTHEAITGGGRRVRLEWFGHDHDGLVDHYMVRLDTLDWEEVTYTDTVLVYEARREEPGTADDEDMHSFSAKAVDDLGKGDLTPAEVPFWSRNQAPETIITWGPSGLTGPMVGIEWEGADVDGVIAAYDDRLFMRDGSTWIQVLPWSGSVTVGPDETSVLFGPLAGMHKFEIWATDNEDATDLTPAELTFTCNPELGAPELTVTTNVLGTHVFKGAVWPSEYNTPSVVSELEHLTFEWTADASAYGGRVLGYRHAYDDTLSWPQWSLDDTSFEITPELGEHSLYISALDNSNMITRARFYISVVEAN